MTSKNLLDAERAARPLIPVVYGPPAAPCGEVHDRPGVFAHVFEAMTPGEACQCGRWIATESLLIARGASCDIPPEPPS